MFVVEKKNSLRPRSVQEFIPVIVSCVSLFSRLQFVHTSLYSLLCFSYGRVASASLSFQVKSAFQLVSRAIVQAYVSIPRPRPSGICLAFCIRFPPSFPRVEATRRSDYLVCLTQSKDCRRPPSTLFVFCLLVHSDFQAHQRRSMMIIMQIDAMLLVDAALVASSSQSTVTTLDYLSIFNSRFNLFRFH